MRFLIVDDSKAMRSILMRALKTAGYDGSTFVEASNGNEALTQVRAAGVDVVLADWNMPEMNGLELLRALRAEQNPVALGFVTSEGSSDVRDLALSSGALFVITKPFTPDVLKSALAAVAS